MVIKKWSSQLKIKNVPSFIDEWYKKNGHDLNTNIICLAQNIDKAKNEPMNKFESWFISEDNSIRYLLDLEKHGYETSEREYVLQNKLTKGYLATGFKGYAETCDIQLAIIFKEYEEFSKDYSGYDIVWL